MPEVSELPLDERMRLYREAMSLREEKGWGRVRIARELGISSGTVSHWIYYGGKPVSNYNIPGLKPNSELAYVIGVAYGDGSTSDYQNDIQLSATDKEFVQEFARCLSRVLNKSDVPVHLSSKGKYVTHVRSRFLKSFLDEGEHKEVIEEYPSDFLRGFFDSEGGATFSGGQGYVYATNTDRSLLEKTRRILSDLRISSKIRLVSERGSGFFINEKEVCRDKDVFELRLKRKEDILSFFDQIGFSISRKNGELEKVREKSKGLSEDGVKTSDGRLYHLWSEGEEEYLVRNYRNKTDREMAEELGYGRNAVKTKRRRMGLSKGGR